MNLWIAKLCKFTFFVGTLVAPSLLLAANTWAQCTSAQKIQMRSRYRLEISKASTPYFQRLLESAKQEEKAGKLQEAVWDYAEAGREDLARPLAMRLRGILSKGGVLEVKPMKAKVSQTATLKVALMEVGGPKPSLTLTGFFKPEKNPQGSSMREIAAYELDQLLGINMVPTTVERIISINTNGTPSLVRGSLQYFVRGAKDPTDPGVDPNRQNQTLRFFDALMANYDRFQNNFLIPPDGRLVAIDHNSGFQPFLEPPYPATNGKSIDVDRAKARFTHQDMFFNEALKRALPRFEVYLRFQKLTDQALAERLSSYLTKKEIDALIERKHKLLADLEWVTNQGCDLTGFEAPWQSHIFLK